MTDGCVHVLYNSSWKFHQLAAGQLLSRQPVRYGKGRQYGPSIKYKITPASSCPGRPPCWASPLAFGLTAYLHRQLLISIYRISLLLGDGRWRQVIRRCASVSDTGVTGVCNWGVQVSSVKKKNDGCHFFPYQIYIFITVSCITGEWCVLGGMLL